MIDLTSDLSPEEANMCYDVRSLKCQEVPQLYTEDEDEVELERKLSFPPHAPESQTPSLQTRNHQNSIP